MVFDRETVGSLEQVCVYEKRINLLSFLLLLLHLFYSQRCIASVTLLCCNFPHSTFACKWSLSLRVLSHEKENYQKIYSDERNNVEVCQWLSMMKVLRCSGTEGEGAQSPAFFFVFSLNREPFLSFSFSFSLTFLNLSEQIIQSTMIHALFISNVLEIHKGCHIHPWSCKVCAVL